MTKINDEVLLDFRDVLIRPKRSTLESRNDVNLSREFKFKHSKEIYEIKNYRASEGKVVKIPARGSVESTLREIKGGVRSAMTYIGARTMKEIPKRTTFVRVSQQLNPMFGN